MGTEDDIRTKLLQGQTPKTLIDLGYKKSTVYKVYETIRQFTNTVNPPKWIIESINFSHDGRYMPGTSGQVSFTFRNKSERDLYVTNLGIQTDWLGRQKQWIAQPIKELLKPGQAKWVSISFPIPADQKLGEYEFYFGLEGQYLPALSYESTMLTTQWSDPKIIEIKRPFTGITIFLSHSVKDKSLVTELEKQLDENGIKVIIGEDEERPGEQLEKKFKDMINSCTMFVALLTDSAMKSPWVQLETQHAININKPRILLKEKMVNSTFNYEWTEFSLSDSPEITLQKIMSLIQKIQPSNGMSPLVSGLIGLSLVGLLLGALSDK